MKDTCFKTFNNPISEIPFPEKFNYPFYYEPHPLAIIAAKEIQQHLNSLDELDHNFGLDETKKGLIIGKMFGVLVVKTKEGDLGYLAAFSGKLAKENHHHGFVPPVYDLLTNEGFFKKEEIILNDLNYQINQLEKSEELKQLLEEKKQIEFESQDELTTIKKKIKVNKSDRDTLRKSLNTEIEQDKIELEKLNKKSIQESYYLKDKTAFWKNKKEEIELQLQVYLSKISQLKEERKYRSSECQKLIFKQYTFLNANKSLKSLNEIFEEELQITPPAGAGECAAPKLLHYAFLNDYEPICMAEFWWGASPVSEVRKHKQFYPACKGKCEPILNHMLIGLNVDDNPMLINPAENKDLPIVYEDDSIIIVNKPAEFLSVPGKNISDSVYTRIKAKYPEATGPLIVHRLDMSTSGILILAKTLEAYHHLQKQFLKRQVKKRYVALLNGVIEEKNGTIELPLRVDLDDRPRQIVCFEHGKHAKTEFEVIEINENQTKVYFYPITGRTHQLRVHASHKNGLNTPIKGDDLYGTKDTRLHLHAESITFRHPKSKEIITFQVKEEF
jgi:tRNA pseudouridine32 synthase/23S rRNA pseudouridine746 synthase